MKKRVLIWVFVLLIPIFSQAKETGNIQGQVMQAGEPVGGVDVILMELPLSTLTDNNGVYILTRIPSGEYTLVFTQGDNSVTKEGVIVTPNTTTKYDVDVEWENM